VLDDDGFYLASVVAELLHKNGCEVTWLTADDQLAPWSMHTLDYRHIRKRIAGLGIETVVSQAVVGYADTQLTLENTWSHARIERECDAVVAITARLPNDALHESLLQREPEWSDAGIRTVRCIGDAEAPGLIAHAVYAGHRYARELEEPMTGEVAFKRHFHSARQTDLLGG